MGSLALIFISLVAVITAQDICPKKFKKIGCFWQDEDGETIFNKRNEIDWKRYDHFILKLACECEKASAEKGYSHFALRFYGICIGLNKVGHRPNDPKKCINTNYKMCDVSSDGNCVGSDYGDMIYEVLKCKRDRKCPVDGGFSKYSDYNTCSASCGGGNQKKTRTCDSPVQAYGGLNCEGPLEESRVCGSGICPVDGGFGDWTNGACSASCGGGVLTRTRKCDSPVPAGAGKDCVGARSETQACGAMACSVDGGFGDYSAWSGCSKTCGGGISSKSRQCNNPAPSGGGKDCVGPRTETKGCANDFCKGPDGVAKAQELVEKFLKNFHATAYPGKKPSGKFYKAIFAIQKAIAEEFASSKTGKTNEKRMTDLEKFLNVATAGGSIDFARTTLGKTLYVFMKKNIKDGLPIDEIDKAATGYLEKLKNDIGEQNWNQVISSQGDSTLMFTMDTTGSMAAEIIASKAIAKSIIDITRDFKVDYILSPFNDPAAGPATYKSDKDRAGFISDINGLRAKGGGDCPERAFAGMLNALDKGPKYGSPMFVFTDASAKDDTAANMAALKSAADMNSATITFFTNLQGCTSGAKRGIKSYQEIASYTSGQIFPLKNEAELLKFKSYVASSLKRDTMIASGGSLKSSSKRSVVPGKNQFNVDDGITELILSIATSVQNTAQQVTLKDPSGATVVASNTMSMTSIYEIKNPKTGTYSLNFPPSVGKFEYTAEGVSRDAIEFEHNFMYQENPRKGSPPYPLYDAIKDTKTDMIIRLGGAHRINMATLRVDIVDIHGSALTSGLKVEGLDSADVLSTSITPPNVPFKIRLSGMTKTGSPFERISRGISKGSTLFLRPLYAGDEFTVPAGTAGVQIQMQVLNFAAEATFSFSGKAQRGSFAAAGNKSIRRMGYVAMTYTAPSGLPKGSTDRLSVTATNMATGETIKTVFSVLVI